MGSPVEVGDLVIKLSGENEDLNKKVNDSKQNLDELGKSAKRAKEDVNKHLRDTGNEGGRGGISGLARLAGRHVLAEAGLGGEARLVSEVVGHAQSLGPLLGTAAVAGVGVAIVVGSILEKYKEIREENRKWAKDLLDVADHWKQIGRSVVDTTSLGRELDALSNDDKRKSDDLLNEIEERHRHMGNDLTGQWDNFIYAVQNFENRAFFGMSKEAAEGSTWLGRMDDDAKDLAASLANVSVEAKKLRDTQDELQASVHRRANLFDINSAELAAKPDTAQRRIKELELQRQKAFDDESNAFDKAKQTADQARLMEIGQAEMAMDKHRKANDPESVQRDQDRIAAANAEHNRTIQLLTGQHVSDVNKITKVADANELAEQRHQLEETAKMDDELEQARIKTKYWGYEQRQKLLDDEEKTVKEHQNRLVQYYQETSGEMDDATKDRITAEDRHRLAMIEQERMMMKAQADHGPLDSIKQMGIEIMQATGHLTTIQATFANLRLNNSLSDKDLLMQQAKLKDYVSRIKNPIDTGQFNSDYRAGFVDVHAVNMNPQQNMASQLGIANQKLEEIKKVLENYSQQQLESLLN